MELLNHFHKHLKLSALCAISLNIIPVSAGVIPLLNPQKHIKKEYTFSAQAQSFLSNDPFSIADLFGDIDGDLNSKSGENIALGVVRFDIGISEYTWGYIGYTYRQEAAITATEDTIELIYKTSNDMDLETGRKYDVSMEIDGFEAEGILFANSFDFYKKNSLRFNIGVGIELLSGKQIQHGYIEGGAEVISEKDYDFYAESNYKYTDNYLYDLDVPNSKAYGYSSHLSIFLEYKNISFLFLANDLSGKLYWDELPYSIVHLSSDNKSYDDDGYVKYQPLLSGKEGTDNYTQTLMSKYRFEGEYKFQTSSIKLGTEYLYSTYLPYITYTKLFSDDLKINFSYETRFRSFATEVNYKNYIFGIRSDDLIAPSTLGLNIGITF